jgi:hypothetical protein
MPSAIAAWTSITRGGLTGIGYNDSMPETIDHDRLFKELLTSFLFEFLELFVPEVTAYQADVRLLRPSL